MQDEVAEFENGGVIGTQKLALLKRACQSRVNFEKKEKHSKTTPDAAPNHPLSSHLRICKHMLKHLPEHNTNRDQHSHNKNVNIRIRCLVVHFSFITKMRVLGIDGGIVNLGICIINSGCIELIEADSIHPSQKPTTAELSALTAQWICERAEKWNLGSVDLVVVESVLRAKIQSVGVCIVAAIVAWRLSNGFTKPKIMMKSGRSKYSLNPHMKSAASIAKGKVGYHDRKSLSVNFCHTVWAVTSDLGPDPCDALLLALAGLANMPKSKVDGESAGMLKKCREASPPFS